MSNEGWDARRQKQMRIESQHLFNRKQRVLDSLKTQNDALYDFRNFKRTYYDMKTEPIQQQLQQECMHLQTCEDCNDNYVGKLLINDVQSTRILKGQNNNNTNLQLQFSQTQSPHFNSFNNNTNSGRMYKNASTYLPSQNQSIAQFPPRNRNNSNDNQCLSNVYYSVQKQQELEFKQDNINDDKDSQIGGWEQEDQKDFQINDYRGKQEAFQNDLNDFIIEYNNNDINLKSNKSNRSRSQKNRSLSIGRKAVSNNSPRKQKSKNSSIDNINNSKNEAQDEKQPSIITAITQIKPIKKQLQDNKGNLLRYPLNSDNAKANLQILSDCVQAQSCGSSTASKNFFSSLILQSNKTLDHRKKSIAQINAYKQQQQQLELILQEEEQQKQLQFYQQEFPQEQQQQEEVEIIKEQEQQPQNQKEQKQEKEILEQQEQVLEQAQQQEQQQPKQQEQQQQQQQQKQKQQLSQQYIRGKRDIKSQQKLLQSNYNTQKSLTTTTTTATSTIATSTTPRGFQQQLNKNSAPLYGYPVGLPKNLSSLILPQQEQLNSDSTIDLQPNTDRPIKTSANSNHNVSKQQIFSSYYGNKPGNKFLNSIQQLQKQFDNVFHKHNKVQNIHKINNQQQIANNHFMYKSKGYVPPNFSSKNQQLQQQHQQQQQQQQQQQHQLQKTLLFSPTTNSNINNSNIPSKLLFQLVPQQSQANQQGSIQQYSTTHIPFIHKRGFNESSSTKKQNSEVPLSAFSDHNIQNLQSRAVKVPLITLNPLSSASSNDTQNKNTQQGSSNGPNFYEFAQSSAFSSQSGINSLQNGVLPTLPPQQLQQLAAGNQLNLSNTQKNDNSSSSFHTSQFRIAEQRNNSLSSLQLISNIQQNHLIYNPSTSGAYKSKSSKYNLIKSQSTSNLSQNNNYNSNNAQNTQSQQFIKLEKIDSSNHINENAGSQNNNNNNANVLEGKNTSNCMLLISSCQISQKKNDTKQASFQNHIKKIMESEKSNLKQTQQDNLSNNPINILNKKRPPQLIQLP